MMPFRVGYYVSVSDRTGGVEADVREMAALENIVTFYVEDTLKSEFAQEAMLAMLRERYKWAEWCGHIEIVPEECLKLSAFLHEYLDEKDVIAYKNNLLEIAISVAQAYRELDDKLAFQDKLRTYVLVIFRRVRAFLGGEDVPSMDSVLNISREERMAIGLLSDSLGIQVDL